ncbi:MAG: 4'-phosphopantetheinyl transferase superfamily protein [Rhizobiales bacterium]|nr:4'-phosphopantetheinyl transferase superfamily protein [Hyphomicrobiales bacterium]
MTPDALAALWPTLAAAPPRAPSAIDVWLADPDLVSPHGFEACVAALSSQERTRADAYLAEAPRRLFVVAHALLRVALARGGAVAPQALPVETGAGAPPRCAGVSLSLSHTDGLVACALGPAGELGLDVETHDPEADVDALAEVVMSAAEIDALRVFEARERRARFYELWTLKEAYLKATGLGPALDARALSFALEGEAPRIAFGPARRDDPARWRFRLARPTAIATLALAAAAPLDPAAATIRFA